MALSRDFDNEEEAEPTKHRERRHNRNHLRLKILVFDIKTEKQIREHDVEWNSERRQWFSALVLWAAKNGKSVEILNVKDDHA